MALKEYIEQIKQDINRSFKAPNVLTEDFDRTHFIRICVVFALNILGIIGFAILKEDFPVSVFVALWGISAAIIIDVLWHIFSKEIAKICPIYLPPNIKSAVNRRKNLSAMLISSVIHISEGLNVA